MYIKLKVFFKKISLLFIMLTMLLTVFFVFNVKKNQNVSAEETHSTKLQSLEIVGYNLNPKFSQDETNYNIIIFNQELNVDINTKTVDSEAKVKIVGNSKMESDNGVITITVTNIGVEPTIYNINYVKSSEISYIFECTNSEQVFTIPFGGTYKLETWGAQGGHAIDHTNTYIFDGGKGGYSKGEKSFTKGEKIYINVGGAGNSYCLERCAGGYNGGGTALGADDSNDLYDVNVGSGGGATSITLSSGILSSFENNKEDILLVAGGGGGSSIHRYGDGEDLWKGYGGAGGGLESVIGELPKAGRSNPPTPATQNEGGIGYDRSSKIANGSFGHGQDATSSDTTAGGGGGYYGGGASLYGSSSGGSGYIGDVSNGETIDGTNNIPSYNGMSTITGNMGNGYAKISLISLNSEDNYLNDLSSSNGTLSTNFDPEILEYDLNIDKYNSFFALSGILSDENSVVTGLGEYEIGLGETKNISISVTSLSGDIRIYNIKAMRDILELTEHSSKLLNLELGENTKYLNPKFQSLIYEYTISIPSTQIDMIVNTETYDSNATVSIEGDKYLKENTGVITITVNESHVEETVYKINYNKDYSFNQVFNSTNSEQVFIAPLKGYYKLETWGAQGGNAIDHTKTHIFDGGKGGYSTGRKILEYQEKLYINVGGAGTSYCLERCAGGYNGGGSALGEDASNDLLDTSVGSGGGATSITLSSGILSSFENNKEDILLVAGGGGGSIIHRYGDAEDFWKSYGGAGGGLESVIGELPKAGRSNPPTAATQTEGGIGYNYDDKIGNGTFGHGQDANSSDPTAGGGGGFYGGGASQYGSSSGGSGYIDNVINGETIAGTKSMPTQDGTSNIIGNEGNGGAKITFERQISNDNYLSTLVSNRGELSPSFDPIIKEYNLNLSKYDINFTLSGTVSDEKTTVTGLDKYKIKFGEEKNIEIIVTSESGDIRIYKIHVVRDQLEENEHSSKLSDLEIEDYEESLTPEFYPLTYNYDLKILSNTMDLKILTSVFDPEATVTITGDKYMLNDTGVITIQVQEPNSEGSVYTINYTKEDFEAKFFDYTGDYQKIIIPTTGKYSFQLWGASGAGKYGGKGGYTYGEIVLKKDDILYAYVGNKNENAYTETFNGSFAADSDFYFSGGGATDIRITPGYWYSENSLASRIMVAGAGGGYGFGREEIGYTGGAGGNLIGGTGLQTDSTSSGVAGGGGGTQVSGGLAGRWTSNRGLPGTFGVGAVGQRKSEDDKTHGSGGGGGYYGGGSAANCVANSCSFSGGGGSSYISGHPGSIAITSENDITPKNNSYTEIADSYHYSNLIFNNTIMKSGNEEMPTHDESTVMTGNMGNGYAKMKLIYAFSRDNYLLNLVATNPTTKKEYALSPEFDPIKEEYNIKLGVDDTEIKLEARPSSDLIQGIEGLGEFDVPVGVTTFPILVTAESGDVRVYNVIVNRAASDVSTAKNIEITGLVPNICDGHERYCELDKKFNENETNYIMTVPAGIRELEFTVNKNHKYQTVIGDGIVRLDAGENIVTIIITSEDGNYTTVYTYEITRDMTGDNYIDELKVVEPETDIGFHYLIQEYSFKVENSVENLKLEVILDDPNANYKVLWENSTVNGKKVEIRGLGVGNNVIEIEVEAANKEVRNYVLDAYRLSNTNPLLGKLEVKNGKINFLLSPEFKDITTNYTLIVENEIDNVDVTGQPQAEATTVTGLGNYTLKTGINYIKVISTAEDGSVETYLILITRKKNANNYLQELSVGEGPFNETFDKENMNYTINLEPHTRNLTINAVPEVSTSKVNIEGNKDFKPGENIVRIDVTAENGEVRSYYITAVKEGSDNNYLSSLNIDGTLAGGFDKEVLEYNLRVGNEVESITLSGEKEDTLASISGFRMHNLKTGMNELKVVVTSETGIKREYKVKVFREYNTNALLENISINVGSLSPSFESTTKEYTVNVGNEVEKITVTGTPVKRTTTVNGNGEYKLEVGETLVTLIGIAEDGVTKEEYRVRIVRDSEDNANLKSLIVKEGSLNPSFDKMTVSYEVKVPNNVNNVNVLAVPEIEGSTVTITGTTGLNVGENTVNVLVTSAKGTTKTYEITVIREEESSTNLNLRTLDLTSCALNPSFNGDTQYYECEVNYEIGKTVVSATLEDENNQIEGLGEKSLKVGANQIVVRVTNPEGIIKDYQVKVTRKESAETRLTKISEKTHQFEELYNPDNREYHIVVKEDKLDLSYIKMHEGQTVEITGNENFILGENIVKVKITAANKVATREYIIHVTKEESDNTYLKSLKVQEGSLNPTFDKGVAEYTVEVENEIESINIKAEAESKYAVVEGTGNHSIEVGENIIIIKVVGENGDERIYRVRVIRKGSNNNYLKSLEIKGYTLSPEFNKETTSYTVEVEDYGVTGIEVKGEAEDAKSIVEGNGIYTLKIGKENKITITVTSETGEKRNYIINVEVRNKITSLLKDIKIKNYNFEEEFESEKLEYTVIVDNEIEALEFEKIETIDPNGSYTVEGNSGFEVGKDNIVKIKSKASDNLSETEYIIHVTRQSYSNTYLSSLKISEGELTPKFEKTTLEYTVNVENEVKRIEIIGTPEVSTSEVSGNGEKELKVGENKYKIIVKSTSGVTRTYTIKVIRKASSNAKIKSITSSLGPVTKIDKTHYKLVVEKGITEVNASDIQVITEEELAKVEKQEKLILTEENKYKIKVTSPDGNNVVEYILEIEIRKNNNTNLKKLEASKGTLSPAFENTTRKYKLNVLSNENEVEFIAEPEEETSRVINTSLVCTLEGYSTLAVISVEAEDGTIGTYEIAIEKSVAVEREAQNIELTKVKEICTECEVPVFSETTYEYTMTVPYEVKEIGIEVTKKHQNQKVKVYKNEVELVEPYHLEIGRNEYKVEIENGLGEKANYVYIIERLKSDNNYLGSLKLISPEQEIEGFDGRNKFEYTVKVGYEYENIELEAVPEDKENATITINGTRYLLEGNNDVSIKVTAGNGDVREYILHVIRNSEHNNLLKTLTVSSGNIYELTPKFTPGIKNYNLEVPSIISKVGVEGLAEDEMALVEGNGEYELKTGINKIKIIVRSREPERVERVYEIRINRLSSKNVYLKRLEVTNGLMVEEFKKETGLYNVNVDNTINSLDMIIETEDSSSTYEVFGNSNLTYGENEVRIKVTSADKSASKTYKLLVNKEGEENNYLKSLKLNDSEENIEGFNKMKQNYEMEVENNVSSISVKAEAESEYARVSGEAFHSLKEGENKVTITVTAQNGEIRDYIISIRRKENCYLTRIVTDRGEVSPTFDRETLEYTVEVENEIKDVTIIGLAEDKEAEVEGNGKYELKVGETKIALKVTNNGSEKTYTITVTRKGNDNNYLKYLTIGEGILSPAFEKETESYVIEIPNTKTELTMEYAAEDEEAKVEEIGNENFTEEEETVTVKVTSTSGKIREYKITVKRLDPELFKAELLDLKVTPGTLSPKFRKDIKSYAVTVENYVEKIEIAVTKENAEQTVEGDGIHSLTVGRNEIKVKVTGKSGDKGIYTVMIYRKEGNDARLAELEFNEGKFTSTFSKNTYNYVLKIGSDIEKISVKKIVPVSVGANVKIEGLILEGGNNKVTIEVTSPGGEDTKTYTITVEREASPNAYLKSLSTNIGTLEPEFVKTTKVYKIKVGNEVKSIEVKGETESTKASIEGGGSTYSKVYDLNLGKNYISITVTSESGNTNLYTIEVEKERNNNANLKSLEVKGYSLVPEFNKETLKYTTRVEEEIEEVIVEAEAEETTTIVTGTGKVGLVEGRNTVTLVTTAEDGSTLTYEVEIVRGNIEDGSSKLTNLEIKEGSLSPEFNKENGNYSILVPNEFDELTISYVTEEEGAVVEITGNENLEVGVPKEIKIKVTSALNSSNITSYIIETTRQISSNTYLKGLEVNKGELSPKFLKKEFEYTVEVENNEEDIIITGIPEVSTNNVKIMKSGEEIENPVSLEPGENLIIVRVTSESGVIRDYKIKVTRKKNSNTYLSSLVTDPAGYSPLFSKEETNYRLRVKEGTETVKVIGLAEASTSEVSGDGNYEIKIGETEVAVTVTAEDGSIKVYTIIVEREASTNLNIINITPSEGELSPSFDNSVGEGYIVKVSKDINVIDFEVETESSVTKVSGNKGILLTERETEAVIKVESEDKSYREIKIKVVKENVVEEIEITESVITLGVEEEYQIKAKVLPEDIENRKLVYEIEEGNEAIDIDSRGKVVGKAVGSAVVKVTAEADNTKEKKVIINVVLKNIRSKIYSVEEKEEMEKTKIVIGMEKGITLSEFKENLENDPSTIKIYNGKGEEILEEKEIIKTGLRVKLEIEGKEYDNAIIILRGDIAIDENGEGDGKIDSTDSEVLLDHTLQQKLITEYNKYAADLDNSEKLDSNDNQRMLDYLQQQISTFN